jgi:hypothetical protein
MFNIGDVIDVSYLSEGDNPVDDGGLELGGAYQIEIVRNDYRSDFDAELTCLGKLQGNCLSWFVRYLKDSNEWIINSFTNRFGSLINYTIEECF